MFHINITPYFLIGTVAISWTAVGYTLAMAIPISFSILEIRRRGIFIHWNEIFNICVVFIIGAFLGGRFFYILDNLSFYIKYPGQIIGLSGIVIYGVVIGSIAAIALYLKIRGLPFWKYRDAVAPGSMLGMSLYRIGCITNGCCYGLPSSSFFSITYIHPESHAPNNIALYPTQIYHLLLGLLTFAILWILRDRLKPVGSLFLLWLILFFAGDLFVRFYRVSNPFIANWQLAQMVDIIMLLITIPWFVINIMSHNTRRSIQ
jgi:phosphatidylglycerol:prolipoprotein diacylglycerol transferase